MVRHCLSLHELDTLLAAQIPQDLADASPHPPVQHLATVLREDDDVILAVPLHVGLALPVFHGMVLLAPRGLPRGGPSQMHAGNGRACRSLTARGGGFVLIEPTKAAVAMPFDEAYFRAVEKIFPFR